MRDRLISDEVFAEFGWDVEIAKKCLLKSTVPGDFRNLLFSCIMQNLKRIGLLAPGIRPRFEAWGLSSYELCQHDADIDWMRLSQPLFESRDAAQKQIKITLIVDNLIPYFSNIMCRNELLPINALNASLC